MGVLTIAWGVALLAIGAPQGAGAAFAGISIVNPIGIVIRTRGALVLEVAVFVGTVSYTRHHS